MDHCRIINCQNIVTPKPKSKGKKKDKKKDKKKNKSSKHNEGDEGDESEESANENSQERYAEPLSCRKQNVRRHWKTHKDQKSMARTLKKEEGRASDGNKINQQLAISHCTASVPIFNVNKELVQVVHSCCEYALEHGVNPVDDRTIHLDPRTIKQQIGKMSGTFRKEITGIINHLLVQEDRECVEIRQAIIDRKHHGEITIEKRMPSHILLLDIQADHARLQNHNFGAIDLTIRNLNLETMSSKCYTLPFQVFEVPDKKGKDSEANLLHLKEFLKEFFKDFENNITKIGLCGDGALVTDKFIHLLGKDDTLAHLSVIASRCTNHAENIKFRRAVYRLLDDLNLNNFRKLFPGRKQGKEGRKIVFFNKDDECRFKRDFHYFLELISCQSNHEDKGENPINFGQQLKYLQLDVVQNEFSKLTDEEKKEKGAPRLQNPLANHDFDIFKAEFFQEEVKINKRKIYTVKSTADLKQRRLGDQLLNMAVTANYAQAIVDKGQFTKSFTSGSLLNDGEKTPSRLSVSFLKKISEFIAAVKYTKALADTKGKSENMPLIRLLLISTKIATRFDCKGQKLPLSNEFTM